MTYQEAKEWLGKQEHNFSTMEDAERDQECRKVINDALEKRTQKKVKYKNRHGDGADLWNLDYYNCPACGRRLRNKQHDPYCGRCGQALDWSDE